MKKLNVILVLFIFLISSCKNENANTFSLENTNTQSVIIKNNSDKELCFKLYFNGINPTSLYGIFQLSGGSVFFSDSINNVISLFNFVCENTHHKDIKSSSLNIYNPVIGIASLGGGLCNVRSAVFTNLLRIMGFSANSIVLEGHVITVVNVDGRNVVLDPDFGVYYFNQNGQIASYEELCSNPELITNPVHPILDNSAPDFLKAYAEETAKMYSSIDDNVYLNTGFSKFSDCKNDAFVIPSKAIVSFPITPKINPFRWTFVKISLPAGTEGNVFAPLVPAAIVGKCKFVFNDARLCVSEFWNNDLQNLQFGQFEIEENYQGVEIYYFVNPKIFCVDDKYLLEIRTINGKTPEVKQFENSYSICEIIENDLLDSCINQNLLRTFSLENINSHDDRFETFVRFCESDSVISDSFLWDSLRSDYKHLVRKRNVEKNDDFENVNPELLRRFFARRFLFENYFIE